MEPTQSIEEETSQEVSLASTKPREELSLEEIAQKTGGTLMQHSQTIRHES